MTRRLVALAAAAVIGGCSTIAPQYGAEAQREGTSIRFTIAGSGIEGGRGWLCPRSPEVGATGGPEGARRLAAAGCIELGPTDPVPPGTLWQVSVDVADLPPQQIAGFPPGASYRLLYITGDDRSGGVFETGIPPVNLRP